jgi:Spy/CpxP family protein refolding chaperone
MTSLTKPKLVVYLVGIFIAGAASGGFIGYNMKDERRHPPSRPPSPEQMIGYVRQKFADEIGVTDQQWQAAIGPIITNTTREIGELDSRNRERIGEIIARSDAQVMEVLTDEQRPRLQKMIEDRKKHFRGGRKGGDKRNWDRNGEKQGPGDKHSQPASSEPASP